MSIDIKTYDLAVSGHDHQDIKGAYSAKMSTPYATSVALIYGKAGLKEFEDDVLSLKEVNELCHKINVEADDVLSSVFPDMQSAIVTIRSSKGEFVKRVDFPKGEPENPLDEMEFKERYQDLMSFARVQRNVYTEVYATMNNLETIVSNLIKNL